jgi:hypothetical protein
MTDDLNTLAQALHETHTLITLDIRVQHDNPRTETILVKRSVRVRELTDEIARQYVRDNPKDRVGYKLFNGSVQLSLRDSLQKYVSTAGQPLRLTYRKSQGNAAFVSTDGRRVRLEVRELPATLGRYTGAPPTPPNMVDFSAFGTSISREHALLSEVQDQYHIENVSKGNFVYVNGDRVETNQSHLLKFGDKVTLGSVRFTFEQQY